MKKILIIILVVFTLFITACSMNYEKRFNELLNLELEEVFETKEEMIAFFERVQANYDNSEYINYKGKFINFMPFYQDEQTKYSYNERNVEYKYQHKEEKLQVDEKRYCTYVNNNEKEDVKLTKYYQIEENERLSVYNYYYNSNKKIVDEFPNTLFRNNLIKEAIHSIGYNHFPQLLDNKYLKSIGVDNKSNIVLVIGATEEDNMRNDGIEFIEVYTFKDEMYVGFEKIIFYNGMKLQYTKETYSYERNIIEYPDFSDYEEGMDW